MSIFKDSVIGNTFICSGIEITTHLISFWWGYRSKEALKFNCKSKRLGKFLKDKLTILPGWTTKVMELPMVK